MQRPASPPTPEAADLERRFHELSVRYELASALTHLRPVDEVLDDVIHRLARAMSAEIAVVFDAGGDDASWRVRRAVGVGRLQIPTTTLPPDLRCAQPEPGSPATALDAATLQRVAPSFRGRLTVGALAQLHSGRRCLGALLIGRVAAEPFPPAQLRMVGDMAGRLALRMDHARLHEELANAELATAVTQAGDAIEIADVEWRVHYVNPAWERLTGIGRDEAVGRHIRELIPLEEASRADGREIARLVREGVSWSGRLTGRVRDGRVIEQDVTVSPARDAAGAISHVVVVRRDRTEAIRAAAALRESEERYHLASLGANDGLWDWNIETGQVYWSDRWKAILGYARDEIGSSVQEWEDRVHPEDRDGVWSQVRAHLSGEHPHLEAEHRMRHKDGRWVWVLTRGLAFRDADGKAIRMAGSQTDITARKGAERQLQYMASHDVLTGLPNRLLFAEKLQACIDRAHADAGFRFAVLFIDLDRFKNVNDSLGHAVGDQLLVTIAQRIRRCLRDHDLAARLGGDEFGVVLVDLPQEDLAIQVAHRIQAALARPVRADGHEIFPGSSIGIALGQATYADAGEALRDADIAMYTAKADGRGRCHVFDARMRARAQALHRLESDLHRALENDEFFFQYQPILDLADARVAGFEALLRWRHPERGLVSPGEFIPVAEESGLIHAIWRQSLLRALLEARRWQAHQPGIYVSVNVSPVQFGESDLVEHVARCLADADLPARCLKIEITENALMRDAERSAAALAELRRLDVPVSLDDFGTGYSSLSMLHRFPIQTLKIDRSFIEPLETRPGDSALVRSIVGLAKNMGMEEVVAEGVETSGQAAILAAIGCTHAQGYHFARPLDADRALAFLAEIWPTHHAQALPVAWRARMPA